jgi:hypothetical protein
MAATVFSRGPSSGSDVGRGDAEAHCRPTAETRTPRKRPERLIYDKEDDSDALRKRLAKRGIDLMCPHRKNRQKPPLQDGRKLRRDKRRWKVERPCT